MGRRDEMALLLLGAIRFHLLIFRLALFYRYGHILQHDITAMDLKHLLAVASNNISPWW
jgi:hypothetical protein